MGTNPLNEGRKNIRRQILLLAGILSMSGLLPPTHAAADGSGDLAVSLTAHKVSVNIDGTEQLKEAKVAKPGETIQYDAVYLNKGKKRISNLRPTLPIPVGLEFIPDTAWPRPASASLDGKTFAPIPLTRTVTLPDGRVVKQEVPASEYRALRWFIGGVAPGAKTKVIARAKLASVSK